MTDFKNVLLSEIKPDPNQPRKYYDETAMQELTDSIKEKGILQPILIRPNGKGYILVCGERRVRAATSAGLKDVPAVIRELTDDEALELQIIENLQRKDVHPMEEAVAFKSLLEKGKSAEDVAARVGKSVFYIKQRLRLNDLSKKFQKAFYAGRMSNATALKLCVIEAKLQDEMFEEVENVIGEISFSEWDFKRMKGDLSKAPFSLEDKTLNKKMGACTSCSFNSAVSLLFPEHEEAPRCTNITCFKIKVDANYIKSIAQYKEDPEIVFISSEYSYSTNSKEGAALVKEGFTVTSKNNYSTIDAPEKPDWEEFEEDNNGDFDTEKELREAFEKEVSGFNDDVAEYNKKIQSGKFKKAFIVDGDEKGRIVYVQLTKSVSSGSSKATKQKEDAGTITVADIDEEITRLNEREKRAKELDSIKVQASIEGILSVSEEFISNKRDHNLTQNELTGAAVALFTAGGSQFRKWVSKNFKVSDYYLKPADIEKLSNLTYFGLNEILFHFIKYTLLGNTQAGAIVLRKITTDYHPSDVKAVIADNNDKAAKRQKRLADRIASLKEEKKALAKPAAKKSAPKKTKT